MKGLFLVPVVMALSAAAGALVLRGLGRPVDVRNLVAAAVIAMSAAEAALMPLLLTRHAGPAAVSQAGLVGTVVHLFLSIALGAAAYVMKLTGRRDAFLFYLLCFYWVSLIYIVTVMAKEIRRSASAAAGSRGSGRANSLASS